MQRKTPPGERGLSQWIRESSSPCPATGDRRKLSDSAAGVYAAPCPDCAHSAQKRSPARARGKRVHVNQLSIPYRDRRSASTGAMFR